MKSFTIYCIVLLHIILVPSSIVSFTPLIDIDKNSGMFKKGISCPSCYKMTTIKQKKSFEERNKQISLAVPKKAQTNPKTKPHDLIIKAKQKPFILIIVLYCRCSLVLFI